MLIHDSFKKLYEDVLLPLQKMHPTWDRLDGNKTVGNPAAYGYFRYQAKTWQINADSHFYRSKEVYDFIQSGDDPFIIMDSSQGKRLCLELKNRKGFKHIYIYQVK